MARRLLSSLFRSSARRSPTFPRPSLSHSPIHRPFPASAAECDPAAAASSPSLSPPPPPKASVIPSVKIADEFAGAGPIGSSHRSPTNWNELSRTVHIVYPFEGVFFIGSDTLTTKKGSPTPVLFNAAKERVLLGEEISILTSGSGVGADMAASLFRELWDKSSKVSIKLVAEELRSHIANLSSLLVKQNMASSDFGLTIIDGRNQAFDQIVEFEYDKFDTFFSVEDGSEVFASGVGADLAYEYITKEEKRCPPKSSEDVESMLYRVIWEVSKLERSVGGYCRAYDTLYYKVTSTWMEGEHIDEKCWPIPNTLMLI